MREGWRMTNLGEICKISTGNANTEDAIENGPYAFFDRSKIIKKSSSYLFDCDAIIIPGEGQTFLPKFFSGKFNLHQRAYAIFNFEECVSIEYVYKYLIYFHKYFEEVAVGATVKSLRLRHFQELPISIPPLPEQQRIVAILDEAFTAIDKAKANAEKNLKNAKALFESYLQGVFENGSWEKKKWGDLCEFVRGPFGGSLKKNMFKDDGYVVYEQKHAIHDHFNQLRYFIDEEKFNEMKRFELFPGDLIMSCSGVTLGRVAIVPEGIKRGIINQALLKLTPKKNVSVHFIKHWLRSRIFQNIIFAYAGGAAIPNVPSAKILKGILIPFPSLIEQERIIHEIDEVLTETKRLESIYQQKLTDLEELKKSILQKAFNGELNTAGICV